MEREREFETLFLYREIHQITVSDFDWLETLLYSLNWSSAKRRAWNTTRHRRLGLDYNRTESYAILAVRKPAPCEAGDRRGDTEWGPLGVHSGAGGIARRKLDASPGPATPPSSLALLLLRRRWRLPMCHIPPPYAPPCPPGGSHSGDTRTFRPTESGTRTYRSSRVRWWFALDETWERRGVSLGSPQRGPLLPRLHETTL